jgi:hypothetical protein
MATEHGYSNQKKKGLSQFKTVHNVGSDAFGTVSVSKSLYDISLINETIVSVTDVIGADGQVKYWKIEITAHGASVGNVLRITLGLLTNFEFEIVEILDVNNLYILPISSSKPEAQDEAKVMGWVTNKTDAEGNVQVSIAPSPEYFLLDGVQTAVSKNTLVPANSTLLPTENLIAEAFLSSIDTKLSSQATEAKQDSEILALGSLLTELQLKADLTETQPVSITTLPLPSGSATEAKQDIGNLSLSNIDGKLQDNGTLDAGNSSTTLLGIGGVFTGAAVEITKYACLNVNVISNVPSATNGVKVEFSPDGVVWAHSHATTYSSASGVGYIFNAEFRYARVVYTNGAVAQATFNLQTILKSTKVQSSLYTLDQTVFGSMFAELNKSTIIGKTTGGGGGFVDVKVTPSGALTAEAEIVSSVLPTGAATEVTLSSLEAKDFATETTLASLLTELQLKADLSETQPVSAASLPLPSGAATATLQTSGNTLLGDLIETAPSTDTASSGLNGRLQRIAQRISSLIALFPTSLGQKTMANSFSVALASDQSAIPVTGVTSVASYQEIINLTNVEQIFVAPVGAKWCKVMTDDDNAGSIRLKMGGTATASSGMIFQPGRSEDFQAVGDISVIAISGTGNRVQVIFGV